MQAIASSRFLNDQREAKVVNKNYSSFRFHCEAICIREPRAQILTSTLQQTICLLSNVDMSNVNHQIILLTLTDQLEWVFITLKNIMISHHEPHMIFISFNFK